MIYLVALLIPPVYFMVRGKWGAMVFNGAVCIFAIICALTVFLLPLGIFAWFVAVVHAMWSLRKELMREHAEMIAQAITKAQGGSNRA